MAGPGGGAALVGASVAPVFSFVEPIAAHTAGSRELSEWRVDVGRSARLPALIAALPGPDREIILSRVVAGVSILAQHQALGALRSAATAHGPPPVRTRVVLLPHARTEPTVTRPTTAA